MKNYTYYLLFILHFLLQACSKPEGVDWKVLEKEYTHDAEKLEALCFIRNNMNDLSSEIPYFYDEDTGKEQKVDVLSLRNEDTLSNFLTSHHIRSVSKMRADSTVLSTDAIRKTIDESFSIWRSNPWKTKISKEMFFNYVLPYKIYGESPEDWRSYFYNRFQKVIANTQQRTSNIDPKIVEEEALKIDYDIYNINENALRFTSSPGLSELICIKGGSLQAVFLNLENKIFFCLDICNFIVTIALL